MKKLFVALLLWNLRLVVYAQVTAFTYQGRLTGSNNAPAIGNYDLRFTIYDSAGGSTIAAGPFTNSPVAISNGLFAVTLDFGAGVFNGSELWLEIAVRTNGNGAFTALNPRQSLTASPYSIFAHTASNIVSGSVVKSLNALKDNVTLAAGANVTITPSGNTLTLAAAGAGGSGIWSVLNNNAYYNAGHVGIGTITPSTYGHGGTAKILEVNNNGTTANSQAHLMLYSGVNSLADSAIGTVTWAQPGGMAAYIGALTRSTTPNSPAALLSFGTRKSGDGAASPKMVITEDGIVGIGTTTPSAGYRLEVNGATILRSGNGSVQFGSPNAELGLSMTPTPGNRADLRFDGSTVKLLAGIGVGPPSSLNGIAINTSGNVGIGTATPAFKLDVLSSTDTAIVGKSTVSGGVGVYGESTQFNGVRGVANNINHGGVVGIHNGAGAGILGQSSGIGVFGNSLGSGAGVYGESAQFNGVRGLAHNPAHGGVVGIHDGGGVAVYGTGATGLQGDSTSVGGYGGYFRNTAGGIALGVQGTAKVTVLQITGGSDLAEPFRISDDPVAKGSVVIIDDERSGHLKLSYKTYDTRVAGIVSGANGVNPGISLQQEGILEGGQNVALSGRVYVLADAEQGAIRPGDLLTTSDTPGHAMKASDYRRTQGAILGKAMSTLQEGKGMVLVLVTLQ